MHILTLLAVALPALALWPQPAQLKTGSKVLKVSDSFSIETSKITPLSHLPDLKAAIVETLSRVQKDNMMILQVDRGLHYTAAVERAPTLQRLFLLPSSRCGALFDISVNIGVPVGRREERYGAFTDISAQIVLPMEQREERYSLIVSEKGSAVLRACNGLGFLRGLQTFEQLVYTLPDSDLRPSGIKYIPNAPISIRDQPAFPYRGQLLDTSRNFFPVDVILKMLQTMSYAKMSAFHWHITDSQSFPLVLPSYPQISAKGAYDPSSTYSPADVQKVIKFANSKGIDVIVEFDNPGHTGSLAFSYPDLIDCWQADWLTYAAEPPAGQLDITSQKSIDLVKGIYNDILPRITSEYFSPGGDELNAACFNKSHPTADFASSLDDFIAKTQSVITQFKKTRIVWEDLVLSHNTGLSTEDTILAVWTSSAKVMEAVKRGYRIIHAASDYFYLDCGQGSWVSSDPDGQSWCAFNSWQHVYSFDPTANLTSKESKLVQGGQTLLWTEQSSPENVEQELWPRAAAAAEVFWTSKTATNRDLEAANARMHDFRYRLIQRGIKAQPTQPHYCALRPGACKL